VGEVPADADPPLEHIDRGRIGSGGAVIEADIVVDPVADSLHSLPPQRRHPEQVDGRVRQHVGEAIAARQRVDEELAGQILDLMLHRFRADLVQRARRSDLSVVTQTRLSRSDHDPPDAVAVHVDEIEERRIWLHIPRLPVNRHAAVLARAHQHHGGHRNCGVEAKLAAHPYPHPSPIVV